jgi:hypothetical protein
MRFEAFGALAFAIGVFALLRGERQIMFWFVILMLFVTAGAVTVTALGGASITVPYILLAFYALWPLLFRRDYPQRVMRSLRPPTPGFWLLLLTLLAILSVFLGPLMFAGVVEVYSPNRVAQITAGPCPQCDLDARPLSFGSAYITQTIYAIGGFVTYVTTRVYLRSEAQYGYMVRAIIALCWLNLFFVAFAYVTYLTNTSYLLNYVRTAEYAMFDAHEVAGSSLMRIQGTFSEASAFASFTLPLFAFCLNLWLGGIRRRTTGVIAALFFACLVLSTSSTAYVALSVYLAVDMVGRLLRAPLSKTTLRIVALGAGGALLTLTLLLFLMAFLPSFAEAVFDFFNRLVFDKLSSDSGIERMGWNRQAFQVFLDTYMLGVGIGGSVASSAPLVILSNLGLPGLVLVVAAIATTLLQRPPPTTDPRVCAVIRAARAAVIVKLIAASLTQRVFSPGLPFFLFLALATSEYGVAVARSNWTALRQRATPSPPAAARTARSS